MTARVTGTASKRGRRPSSQVPSVNLAVARITSEGQAERLSCAFGPRSCAERACGCRLGRTSRHCTRRNAHLRNIPPSCAAEPKPCQIVNPLHIGLRRHEQISRSAIVRSGLHVAHSSLGACHPGCRRSLGPPCRERPCATERHGRERRRRSGRRIRAILFRCLPSRASALSRRSAVVRPLWLRVLPSRAVLSPHQAHAALIQPQHDLRTPVARPGAFGRGLVGYELKPKINAS